MRDIGDDNIFKPLDPIIIPPIWGPVIIDLNCRTRILMVTDGLSFGTGGFGLSEAVSIVEASSTTNHPVEITTAHTGASPADVTNFTFGTHTVGGETRTLDDYEEIWLFGVSGANSVAVSLAGAELTALTAFMDNGGGVFACGDHEDLGAYMCGPVPRVGTMRLWYNSDGAPDGSNADTRIDTNVPSGAAGADFDLQSDNIAQRIYPKWYVDNSSIVAHELLSRHDLNGTVTHLPDHPHEGKIVEPTTLDPSEYPSGLAPEIVAWGVSGGPGTGVGGKEAIVPPELFGVIGAYDGRQVDVGRVVVDSTWHHWLNINLNGSGSGPLAGGVAINGLHDSAGNPTPEYEQIMDYFQNIAGWLEPFRLRICWIIILWPILRWSWPTIEHLRLDRKPELGHFIELGEGVLKNLASTRGGSSEDVVSLITSNMKMNERLQAFLDPRSVRSRKLRSRIEMSPLMDRSRVMSALVGGSMWNLAKNLPESQDEGVKAVRKLLKIRGDEHDTSGLFKLITDGAELGYKLVSEELSRPSAGNSSLKRAM